MSDDNDIVNIKIAAGKRTYFVDVKQTRERKKYLKISENKRLDDGKYERYGVIFFEEDINNLVDALRSALQHFPTYKRPESKSRMEETKEKFSNAYQPWTKEDDNKLTELFCQGKTLKELSDIFQRNIGAITSRIAKLNLKERY